MKSKRLSLPSNSRPTIRLPNTSKDSVSAAHAIEVSRVPSVGSSFGPDASTVLVNAESGGAGGGGGATNVSILLSEPPTKLALAVVTVTVVV